MMTAEIRKIRSSDLEPADEASAIRESDAGPVVLNRLAMPFNDNARGLPAAEASALSIDMSSNDVETSSEPRETTMSSSSQAVRRRGPLVTRWIGYAAHRRQAQARASGMRKLQTERASTPSEH